MMGVICSTLAWGSAALVTRRTAEHRYVRDALLAALMYAICRTIDPEAHSPRALLVLLACAALQAGWAYDDAWNGSHSGKAIFTVGVLGYVIPAMFDQVSQTTWAAASFGPLILAASIGLISWTLDGRTLNTITRRICATMIVGDIVGMLALFLWPGIIEWEGRAMAITVTALQGGWLLTNRKSDGI